MILFFDRSVGKRIPATLKRLRCPINIKRHGELFPPDALDDEWLPVVGANGWLVAGFDHSYHKPTNEAELEAIKNFEIGVFYLWGPEASMWDSFTVFVRAFPRMVAKAQTSPRPFIYRIRKNGALHPLTLS